MRLPTLLPAALGAALAACAMHAGFPAPIPVFFRNDSVMLGEEARQAVARAAEIARANPERRVELVGYGLPSSVMMEPLRLSVARNEAVRAELVRDGVPAASIRDHAGGALPPAPDTPVSSRRVDISFTR